MTRRTTHVRGLALCAMALATAAPQAPPADPGATKSTKETLHYRVEWRLVTAGAAKLAWDRQASGNRGSLTLQSSGIVSRLFKVNDAYSAKTDNQFCAESSLMNAEEGSRKRATTVAYDGMNKKASYLERDLVKNTVALAKETEIPACVHEVLGGLQKLRPLKLEPGHSVTIPISDGKKSIDAKVEAQARETIRTPAGSYNTMRYEANLFNNQLFVRPGRLFIWVSDDERHLPVQIQIRLRLLGSITIQLEKEEHS